MKEGESRPPSPVVPDLIRDPASSAALTPRDGGEGSGIPGQAQGDGKSEGREALCAAARAALRTLPCIPLIPGLWGASFGLSAAESLALVSAEQNSRNKS